jgi:tetratricopeptide (TPR) repeat protein
MNLKSLFSGLFMVVLFSSVLSAQNDAKLANYYYQSGEYEKSAVLFKKLSEQSGFNEYYFEQYIESLMALETYTEAEKAIKAALAAHPRAIQLFVTYGSLLDRVGRMNEAEIEYRKAIENLNTNRSAISTLGNSFMRLTKYELALETFEKGESITGNSGIYSYSIAEIYRRQNDMENMISYYLESAMATISRITSVQNYFNRYLTSREDFELLRLKLYEKVQERPEDIFFPEMIQWVFIRNKQYARALRQARALDRRLDENGSRVYNLARIAANDRDFETAIEAYDYIVTNKLPNSPYYIDAKKELLESKRKQLITSKEGDRNNFELLRVEYETFLDEVGRSRRTALVIMELAELEALYLNNLDRAVELLQDLIELPGLNNYIRANAKLDLGDYFLMNSEVWEATLLYSQVDKEFREDHLGEMARFKNAKLSYYIGDFEWSQEQFDILKSATSRLISNDAIDLSVFIMDNANLDTTYAPLQLFAEAELLFFQNRTSEAFAKLDSIQLLYPDHTLEDDVLFIKAESYKLRKEFDLAVEMYNEIIKDHPDAIRADNAIFSLASLYEFTLEDPGKAMELYEKLFIEYSDSTFAIEARKRFRILRGDRIQ